MSTTARPASNGSIVDLLSPRGQELARALLRDRDPFDIHDFQLEGACIAASGTDLVGCIPTGGEKTALWFLPMLLIDSIHKDSTLSRSLKKKLPPNPVLIGILPTNVLETEKASEFQELGLNTIPINTHTLQDARRCGENLWQTARRGDVSPFSLLVRGERRFFFFGDRVGLRTGEPAIHRPWVFCIARKLASLRHGVVGAGVDADGITGGYAQRWMS